MINWKLIREFKPALLFVGKFVGLYIILNLMYGLYVNHYYPNPDPVTILVTNQTSFILNQLGEITATVADQNSPNQNLYNESFEGLSVFEGCNGLNTMIIFVAFLLAFGKPTKALIWFMPAGIVIIHLFNLLRISGLYYITIDFEQYLYFTHKYLFTGFLFAVIFALWYVWVSKIYIRKN